MPLYRFACSECQTEVIIARPYEEFTRSLVHYCSSCRQAVLHRLLPWQSVTFHLKGSGFYTTDNRDEHERYLFEHFD